MASGAADEVAKLFNALNKTPGLLLLEKADTQEPGLGVDEYEPALVFAGTLLVLELHDLAPGHVGEAGGLV